MPSDRVRIIVLDGVIDTELGEWSDMNERLGDDERAPETQALYAAWDATNVYLIGGYEVLSGPATNRTASLGVGWTPHADMIQPRAAAAVGMLGSDIYVAGGRTGAEGVGYQDSLFIHNISLDSWSEGPSLPYPVGDAVYGVHNGE